MTNLKGLSLFSGGGIGEMFLKDINIDVVVANELIQKRASFYSYFHPKTKMFVGDIKKHYMEIIKEAKKSEIDFIIATPPCQGMSTLGKKDYENDLRNYLIYYVLEVLKNLDFKYCLIENVPKFLKMYYPYNNTLMHIDDILKDQLGEKYVIESSILNVMDYGVPQCRPRSIIRIYKKNLSWDLPKKEKVITLKEAIGDLPSLESGEASAIKYHYAPIHNEMHINVMKHTPEGKSAMQNKVYYPKKRMVKK